VSKKLDSKSVDDNWDGLNVQSVLKPHNRPVSFSIRHANLLNRDDLLTSLDTFKTPSTTLYTVSPNLVLFTPKNFAEVI
jgi:hypothetical protein